MLVCNLVVNSLVVKNLVVNSLAVNRVMTGSGMMNRVVASRAITVLLLSFCQSGLSDVASAQLSGGFTAALQAAVMHNPLIKEQSAELDAQGHNIGSAKAGRFPSLSAQANSLEEEYDQGTMRLQQPLWAFGKIDNQIDQAQAEFGVQQWDLYRNQRSLIESTAAAYAAIDGIQQQIEVAGINVEEHERLYQRIKRRQEGKLASEADVRLAYSRRVMADSQQQRLVNERMIALTELQALTQVAVAADESIDSSLVDLPLLSALHSQARANSAELRYQRELLEVVKLDIKKEKIASTPTIYFRVEHEFLDTPDGFEETRAGFAIEANVEGLGLADRGRIRSAASRLTAAQYAVDVSATDVERRVNKLVLSRRLQHSLGVSQQLALTALEETMASFVRQYESGRKSWLEVLNTQRELTELRLQLAQINSDWLTLSLRLSALTGGLDTLAGLDIPRQQENRL